MYDLRPLVKGSSAPPPCVPHLRGPLTRHPLLLHLRQPQCLLESRGYCCSRCCILLPMSHLPRQGPACGPKTFPSSGLEDGKGPPHPGAPMSADHKSSTEDPAQAHVALALVLGDIFYFFFFFSYWKMSLWGSECQLVYIKIVNCLKNILWWIHETARKGSLPGLQLSALYTDEWPPGRGEGIPPDLEVCCTDANTAQSCGMTLSLMLVGERG